MRELAPLMRARTYAYTWLCSLPTYPAPDDGMSSASPRMRFGASYRHAKFMTFQMAEVAVPSELFAAILERIQRLGVPPPLQRG
ncbi:MAG: hypothetical protein IID42_10205 [Planctomycetes bacterium]|nr:hypothetical protein [Planctomycetota bacterium]